MHKSKNNLTWEEIIKEHARLRENETLASEIITQSNKISKSKDFLIECLLIGLVALGIGATFINYCNDQKWRKVFSSYDN